MIFKNAFQKSKNPRERKNFLLKKSFTLIELLVVIAIINLLVSITLVGLKEALSNARDARRLVELHQVQKAIECASRGGGNYVVGTFFSVWDTNYGHTTYYWSGGNPPWSTAFYEALVGSGCTSRLPLDPVNREEYPDNFLGDGPPKDLGYVYWSNDPKKYILGTNLERGGISVDPDYSWLGNYRIKGGEW